MYIWFAVTRVICIWSYTDDPVAYMYRYVSVGVQESRICICICICMHNPELVAEKFLWLAFRFERTTL